MTISGWREFLQRWSEEWLARDEKFSRQIRERCWLGSRPATEKQISHLEKRLGYRLPPSYRNFLLTTNGWSRTSVFIKRVLPASKVDWLQTLNPQLLDTWSPEDSDNPAVNDLAEYFSYDGRPIFDAAHLRQSLLVAEPIDGDSKIYVLNPLIVAPDGEWEAWRFANWIPGAERFPSFELLMRAEFESFSSEGKSQHFGPYQGIYAPDQPRHIASKIGPGRVTPKRLTVPELIVQLESQNRASRLSAAKHLLREFCPHNPDDEHPEIVGPLSRILESDLEPDVRSAAAAMLGSYGDVHAIDPLTKALDIPELTAIAISALFYLSLHIPDSRIADAMVRLLERPRALLETEHAVHILEELKDARLEAIGLRLLDEAPVVIPNVKDIPNLSVAQAFQRSSLRFLGAFAFAKHAANATEELVKRLAHANSEIRAAAVAALREDPHRGLHLSPHLAPLLDDPDTGVRQQASTTLRFLDPMPAIEISAEKLSEIENQVAAQLKRASQRKSRF
jgi:HEAT repeat protein